MAVLEKEVEGLEEKIDCYKSTINRRNVMITRMKCKLDDKDEYMYINTTVFCPDSNIYFCLEDIQSGL